MLTKASAYALNPKCPDLFYTYILYSESFDKFYIGQTVDIVRRLERHNRGTEHATKPYIPWKMIWYANKETRVDAVSLEKKLKNLTKQRIREFVLKHSKE